jgi:hypothetical protein
MIMTAHKKKASHLTHHGKLFSSAVRDFDKELLNVTNPGENSQKEQGSRANTKTATFLSSEYQEASSVWNKTRTAQ